MDFAFKILKHSNSDNVHLNLMGHFDSRAAAELANMIEANMFRCRRLFIHTCLLSSITSAGLFALAKRMEDIGAQPHQFKITGDYSNQMERALFGFDVYNCDAETITRKCRNNAVDCRRTHERQKHPQTAVATQRA